MNHQSKQQFNAKLCTWVVAILLVLILIWMLLTGRGPTNACCEPAVEAPIPAEMATESNPSDDNFSFTATMFGFSSNGDSSHIAWLGQIEGLNSLLSGEDIRLHGNEKNVLLSGIVESEAIKQQKGIQAQEFFGPDVIVDNQLVIKAGGEAFSANTQPDTVNLYFDSGKTMLPRDASISLAAIVEWLKTHPESKVILSGYHDAQGNKASNEQLAKDRAESVEDALEDAGIDDDRIDLRKPQSVDGGTDLAEARRVEVSIE